MAFFLDLFFLNRTFIFKELKRKDNIDTIAPAIHPNKRDIEMIHKQESIIETYNVITIATKITFLNVFSVLKIIAPFGQAIEIE